MRLFVQRKVAAQEVVGEAGRQIQALRRLGIMPTHWDTHQHVAELPQLARLLGRAAKDAGIVRARTPRVWIVNGTDTAGLARWRWRSSNPWRVASEVARALSHRTISRDFKTPRYRAAARLVTALDTTYAERWKILLSHLPPGLCEVMTHPGYVDRRLLELTPELTADRLVDLDVAKSARTWELLAGANVGLIPFARL